MKHSFLTLTAGLLLTLSVQAGLYNSGLITVGQTIPTSEAGSSSWTVSGATSIDNMSVYLNISGGSVGDVWVQLVSPNDKYSILLNRVGIDSTHSAGAVNAGFAGWLYDTAAGNIHGAGSYSSTSQLTGDYRPDGRDVGSNDKTGIINATPIAMSTSFIGADLNGAWTIKFFNEVAGAGSPSTLNSWQLTFGGPEPVPEPVNVALGIFGGLFAVGMAARSRAVRARVKRCREAFVEWVNAV